MTPRGEWHLETRRLGRRVLVFSSLDSTSNLAASLANDPANDGVVILADEQTAGRGQHGRSWACPPGSGVLMSVVLFPPPELRRPAVLTTWAAVAVCETIRELTGLQAKIKWPNDVLVSGLKICGILIEGRTVEGCVIAGIGLNVRQSATEFAAAGLTEATSLSLAAGTPLQRDDVARELIRQLDQGYDLMCTGDLATLEACWKWRLGLLGRRVRMECADGTHVGRLLEVSWSGLELHGEGEVLCVQPEAVRHLSPA